MSLARVTVEHSWYGCETGCCGHSVSVETPADVPDYKLPRSHYCKEPLRRVERFFFEHPYDADAEVFAKELVEMACRNDSIVRELIEACGGYEFESIETSDD